MRLAQKGECGETSRTIGDLDDVTDALPRLVQLAAVPELELVADGEADLAALELGEVEPGGALLVETHVPADDEGLLGLGFFELLVVVGLDLHERAKDVLILVRVFVPVRRLGARVAEMQMWLRTAGGSAAARRRCQASRGRRRWRWHCPSIGLRAC
jgi:hypothetical protein